MAHYDSAEMKSGAPGYEHDPEGGHRTVMMVQMDEAAAPGFMAPEKEVVTNQSYLEFIVSELRHPTFVQSILAEWWGTSIFLFFLILSVLPGVTQETTVFRIATVAGLMICVLVYGLYGVSGGNLNPAVSLGLAMSGRMTPPRAVGYILAQMVGAITGVAMTKAVSPGAFNAIKGGVNSLSTIKTAAGSFPITANQAVWAEVMGTFLLVLVVLFCTDTHRTIEHPHMTALIPFAIGFVVLLDHIALIPIDGCSINPARSFGSAVITGKWEDHWVFWVGPMVGGAFAAAAYRMLYGPTDAFNALWGKNGVWTAPTKLAQKGFNKTQNQ